MAEPTAGVDLARWVPRLLHTRLGGAPGRRAGDAVESLQVAALWIDISGFTPLTRRFAEQGARGAEAVGAILNQCYGALTDQIAEAGGDVVDYAGDGILAVWPVADGESLGAAVGRAEACARVLQTKFDRMPAAEDAELRFYMGVGAGEVFLLDVGGVGDRWRFLVAGDPLRQIGAAKAACAAGDVVLSPEAQAARATPEPGPASPPLARAIDSGRSGAPVPSLRDYVVDAVLKRLDAGLTDWLAEFRLASVVFVIVPEPDVATDAGRAALRAAAAAAQAQADALDGSLNQVIMDDTGLVMLLAWGVPDHTHEDDARRALQAAVELRGMVSRLGFRVHAGVATGRVFCGACGNARRTRYALVGTAVNRAARIAMASPGDVRCDARTREGADRWLRFADADMVPLKGMDAPIALFRLGGVRAAAEVAPAGPAAAALSGRERERRVVADALAGASGGAGPPLLLIEGEPGIGKSVLLRHVATESAAPGRRLLVGAADAVERSTAYFPWREPFRALFGVTSDLPLDAARRRVTDALRPLQGREERVPLLEPVLTIGLEDNATTRAMAGVDRGVATRELLCEALDLLGGPAPVIVLDDLHWFDSASLELVSAIRHRVPRALVAAATRPPADDAPPQLLALATAPGTVRIPLVEMAPGEVLGMLRGALGVDELPAPLAAFLVERGEGHPLFTMELALLLRDMGVIRVDGRRCTFDPDDHRLSALRFSERAEGIVATRIDRLPPSHQLALKVASVVGRSFEFQIVHRVYPIAEERAALRGILDDLTRPRLIEEEHPDPALAYLFRHVVIREVAYGLVAYSQRRHLHTDVARTLEASHEAGHAANYPLLAHHWRMAEEAAKAMEYLERAGTEALRRGAGREAFTFFQDALTIAERERGRLPSVTTVRLAELERLLGEATEQLLDVPESSRWMERALGRIGHRVAGIGAAERRREMTRQVAIQLGHILWPLRLRRRPRGERAAALELAARAYGTLAEHAYFESDLGGMLLFSLTSVNLAEQARAPAAAERSYVSLAHTTGLLGMAPLTRRYRRLSANTTLGRTAALREVELAGRFLARGEMEAAAAAGERTARVAARYADRHHEAQGWGAVVSAMLRLGCADLAAEAAARIYPTGRDDWARAGEFGAWVLSGRPSGALERFASVETWEPAFALAHHTALVLWAEERGDWTLACTRADAALAVLEGPGLKNAFTTGHYANLLAFHSRALHRLSPGDTASRAAVMANVRRLEAELRRHARLFWIGRPRLEQARAMLAYDRGRWRTGDRHITRGLRVADRYAMAADACALLVEQARWRRPGWEAALARARAECRDRGMDRLLLEVDAAGR